MSELSEFIKKAVDWITYPVVVPMCIILPLLVALVIAAASVQNWIDKKRTEREYNGSKNNLHV